MLSVTIGCCCCWWPCALRGRSGCRVGGEVKRCDISASKEKKKHCFFGRLHESTLRSLQSSSSLHWCLSDQYLSYCQSGYGSLVSCSSLPLPLARPNASGHPSSWFGLGVYDPLLISPVTKSRLIICFLTHWQLLISCGQVTSISLLLTLRLQSYV